MIEAIGEDLMDEYFRVFPDSLFGVTVFFNIKQVRTLGFDDTFIKK